MWGRPTAPSEESRIALQSLFVKFWIPSFSNSQQIFYASTFISYITSHKIQLFKAFALLKSCYELGIIHNKKEEREENEIINQ